VFVSSGSGGLDVPTFLLFDNDADLDGIANDQDNCLFVANTAQVDADGDGAGDICDLCPGFDDNLDCNSNGVPDGCEPDCNSNAVPDECDLTAGTSQDCNLNTIPDECDIAAGTSPDCDGDGLANDCVTCNDPEDCDDCNSATTDGCFRNRCIRLAACSVNFVPGDMDGDGDLDLDDFAIMSLCFSGPDGVIPQSCPFGGGAGLP